MVRDEARRIGARIPSFRALMRGCGPTIVCAFIASWPVPASAQDASAEGVRDVIDRVFEGMQEADSAKVRSAFADGARFALLPAEGEEAVQYRSIDGWLAGVAGSEGRWQEKIYDVEIRVDDDMASAWTPYTFYLDGQIRHCGVNSIELLRTPDGWKITQVSDTRRMEGCPDPSED